MKIKKQILLSCILLQGVLFAQAQTTVTTGGGEASGSGGTVSYSVGQVAYQTHSGTNGSIAEGVQQPYEISIVTGIEKTIISLNISAYPNPTLDFLTLKTDAEHSKCVNFQLYDLSGKLLQSDKLTATETQINMSSYVPSTYFLRVITENKSIKEFKIIKTQ